ncbi:MAG: MFS transporter [Deltaproteobacteria bacterium]|nr:MFS transporter [Deltaproteobacteria bacterium]
MISSNSDSVSRRALIGYGLATLPAQSSYVVIIIMYLKYSVVELGASAAAIGSVFQLAKVWDAISDPLVGNLSDRTERSQGRRRPRLYASAPLLFVFSIMLWVPPAGLEGAALIAWIGVAVFGFYTAYTIFEVPPMALGAELTFDRRERNLVFGTIPLVKLSRPR